MKNLLKKFIPTLDRWQLILITIFTILNIVFLSIVTCKNDFDIIDFQVISSFIIKIIFDAALILFIVLMLKKIFKNAALASLFLTFNILLSVANILLYYFGNTMVEKHHFALITPYSVTSFVPWYGFVVLLITLLFSFIAFYKITNRIDNKNLFYRSATLFILIIILTFLNSSGLFRKEQNKKLDKVIMGFRNAQLYYTSRNQFLSLVKDVVFPTLGERFKKLSPATADFVSNYDLSSDEFKIKNSSADYKNVIDKLAIPIDKKENNNLNLKPFKRIIYIFTESISLKTISCYNKKLKTPFADKFFCSENIMQNTFNNLYTTGSPTLQGITVTMNSHPNYNIQNQTGYKNSLPKFLKRKGYNTVFIRSASKYFANENIVFKSMGFSKIIGREDFYENENLKKYIYGWGLEDRILYDQTIEYIESHKDENLFIAVFGTDTHPPHGQRHYKHLKYPERKNLKKNSNASIYRWLKAVDNMDYDLNRFIKRLDQKGLFDEQTLIVVSADHSCPLNNVSGKIPGHPKNNLARIPFIILSKQKLPEVDKSTLASQIDIAPTIFNLLGYNKPYGWWGDSLFNRNRKPYSIGFEKGFLRFTEQNNNYLINTDKPENKFEKEFIDFFDTVLVDEKR